MGCSGCTKVDGCEAEKGPQRTAIDEILDRVYPGRVWGSPDDEARFRAGISPGEAKRLQQALSTVTKAPTFFRSGEPDDLCHFIYVLCFGREPALVDMRDGLISPELDPGAEKIAERYLRIALSTVGRVATVQEVGFELEAQEGGAFELREAPRPGVYDPTLLKRMRTVVDYLEASDIEHLDFGMVDKPVENAQDAEYVEQFGQPPGIVNYLFYAQPARTETTTSLNIPS